MNGDYQTKIISFVGFKQVGKSTAAKYLEDKYGFVRHNFKDGLVAEIKEKFPDLLREIVRHLEIRRGEFETKPWTINRLFIEKPPLMRALLQNYGTEVRRGDDPDYWILQWKLGVVEKLLNGNKYIVADDVRFINEANSITGWSGTIIRLTRPDLPTGGDHSSETEQLQIEADYTIECEAGDFEKLYRELDRVVENSKSS